MKLCSYPSCCQWSQTLTKDSFNRAQLSPQPTWMHSSAVQLEPRNRDRERDSMWRPGKSDEILHSWDLDGISSKSALFFSQLRNCNSRFGETSPPFSRVAAEGGHDSQPPELQGGFDLRNNFWHRHVERTILLCKWETNGKQCMTWSEWQVAAASLSFALITPGHLATWLQRRSSVQHPPENNVLRKQWEVLRACWKNVLSMFIIRQTYINHFRVAEVSYLFPFCVLGKKAASPSLTRKTIVAIKLAMARLLSNRRGISMIPNQWTSKSLAGSKPLKSWWF